MAEKFWPAWRIVVYNTCGSYGATSGERRNPLPGFVFVFTVFDLLAVLRQSGSGPVRVCFTPIRSGSKQEVFCDVCTLICDFSKDFGSVVFAVEEIWNFQTASWSPEPLEEIMLQWGHYGLRFMWNAQLPQKTDSGLRSMTNEVYIGKFDRKLDLQAIADCRLNEKAMLIVPTLAPRRFVHKMQSGEWRVEP